jgi:hypothetical protein
MAIPNPQVGSPGTPPARRTYSPILRQASLPDTITVPWWEGRMLRYQYD